jgi:hypothetical protein
MLGLGLGFNKNNSIKKNIVKEGLILYLNGKDFSNNPPTNLWKDRSTLNNDTIPSNFGYIIEDGKVHFEIEGETLKNELTYNKNTYDEWLVTSPQLTTKNNTGIEITSDNVLYPNVSIHTNMKPATKYGMLYNVVSCTLVDKFILDGKCFNYQQLSKLVGNNKSIQTSNSAIMNNKFGVQIYNVEPAGNKIKFKDFRVYELPAGTQIEADFINLTADQLALKYPFTSGIKSVGEDFCGVDLHGLSVLSRGKNLIDINAITKRTINSIIKIEGNSLTITDDYFCPIKVKVKPNTDYFIQAIRNGAVNGGDISVYSNAGIIIKAIGKGNTFFNSGNNSEVNIYLYAGVGVVSTSTFSNIMLSEGTTIIPYTPYIEDINNIVLTNPLRKVGTIADKYSEGVVTRNVGKVVLNGSEDWSFVNTKINTILFRLNITKKAYSYMGIMSDRFIVTEVYSTDIEGFQGSATNSNIFVSINKSKLATQDISGFKAWLQANPTTVYYQLATPTTEVISVLPLNKFEKGSLLVDSGIIPCKTTILNYAPSGSDGRGGVVFDGIDDILTIDNKFNNFTFQFKMRLFNNGTYARIFSSETDTQRLYYDHISNKFKVGTTTYNYIYTSNTIIVLTIRRIGTSWDLFINGNFIGSIIDLAAQITKISIFNNPTLDRGLIGTLYSFIAYDKALSDTEILQNYKALK